MRFILRVYSYLFHLLLALFLFALGIMTIWSGVNNLSLGMLPWEGATLTTAVLALGGVGLLITVLAISGRLKILFPLWAAFVLVMLVRGFFLSSFVFHGADGFRDAIWVTFGALVAFLSSWMIFGQRRRPN